MRLKLKILHLFMWYFFKVKIVKNGVLREWRLYVCLRFRRHFFRRTKLGDWWVFKKNLGLKGVMEKCVGCFLVYLFLRVLFCFKKVLRDRKFKFLCETYPPVSCNTHYSVFTVSFMWGCLELKYSKKDTISWNVLKTTKIS